MERKPRIGVIGPSQADEQTLALAEQVGSEVAKRGAILICGGLGGVMEAAARGAKREHGVTVGILPTPDAFSANLFIDIPIATGLGEARNVIVVHSVNAIIAIAGGYGTLSEIAFALRLNIPVVGLGTWQVRSPDGKPAPLVIAESPFAAVEKALAAVTR
jgi:hypothetical protein